MVAIPKMKEYCLENENNRRQIRNAIESKVVERKRKGRQKQRKKELKIAVEESKQKTDRAKEREREREREGQRTKNIGLFIIEVNSK